MLVAVRSLAVFVFLGITVVAISQSAIPAESDDGRQWIDSQSSPNASPIAAASRANAFNQNETAEKLLRQVIRHSPLSHEANEAYKLLSRICIRTGRYKSATDNLNAWLRAFPHSADAQAEVRDVEQFRGLPDQINGRRRASVLKHDGSFAVPLSVNGKECTFLMDTGAWVSIITQQAAERLGLEFRDGGGVIGESSGNGIKTKVAVAKKLVLGNMQFQNVSFFVIPDEEPFNTLPLDQRGILGVPIHFGIGNWQWSKSGTIHLGERIVYKAPVNLVLFKNKILVSAEIAGQRAFLTFDSGANKTDLNSNFAAKFGHLLTNATKTTSESLGLGGRSTFEAYALPELGLSIAGRTLTLRPADVTLQKLPSLGGQCCVGNFGNDLLTQAAGFLLDLDNMSLTFH